MHPRESSVIKHFGYYHEGLEVTFHSGATYRYEVPKSVYETLRGAPSQGKCYNAQIKGKYPCREVPLHRSVEIAYRAYALVSGCPVKIPCVEFCGDVILIGSTVFDGGAEAASDYLLKLAEQRLERHS